MEDGQDFVDAPSGLPDWLSWIQLGLTTMLVVLFLVLMARGRDQRGELRALEARLEGLENSRALEKEPILEKQMQSIIQRLEQLEGEGGRLETLGQQQGLPPSPAPGRVEPGATLSPSLLPRIPGPRPLRPPAQQTF
jgi:hypothetical protein